MRLGPLLLTILIPLSGVPPGNSAVPRPGISTAIGPGTKVAGGPATCLQIELTGEAQAGREWSADIGQGWQFRLVPIAPSGRNYTGWDLAVSRSGDSSYPDALLLATPPYDSLSQREIGTTFGLRAQDAIAWEPRRFRFLTSPVALDQTRVLFRNLTKSPSVATASAEASSSLLAEIASASTGEFTILDATLIAGAADPPAFAQQWAAHLGHVPHTLLQASNAQSSPRGELRSIKFRAILSLPGGWKIPIQGTAPAGKVFTMRHFWEAIDNKQARNCVN